MGAFGKMSGIECRRFRRSPHPVPLPLIFRIRSQFRSLRGLFVFLETPATHSTIQQIKSTIKEIKEDEFSNSLAKIQVCAMFRAGDIRRNVLLKFTNLRKLPKTYVIEFCYKKTVVVF